MSAKKSPVALDKDKIWRAIPQFLLFNAGIAFLLILFFCPRCLLSWEGITKIFPYFVYSFLISTPLSFGGYLTDRYLDKRIPWVKFPIKRLLLTILIYGTYCAVASFIIIFLFVYGQGRFSLEAIPWAQLLEYTQLPVTLGLSFMAFFTVRSWLYEWRNAALETEQLKSENLASRYQSLKDQLNPHFLFNSLNVLSHLVYENADKSAAFIQQLSKIYRYVLEVQQEELVSLEQELDFAKSYLGLQKIRFGAAMDYQIDVPYSKNLYLPPLSLQLLLENALKHNVASIEKPLQIRITKDKQNLVISNNLQRKKTGHKEVKGIGLDNITKRYALLSNVSPVIKESVDTFTIELPLLETDVFSKT